jgi:hypothetical protein
MALRSLKNLDLPQDRFPFVSSPSLPSPATNSHLSKTFLYVIKSSHFGAANTPSSFRFAHMQFFDDPVFWHPFYGWFIPASINYHRSRWPRGLRRRSTEAWLLESRVRIPLRVWMFVSCVYMLFSCVGRGLCEELITRPEESYRVSNYVWLRNLNTEEDKAQRGL